MLTSTSFVQAMETVPAGFKLPQFVSAVVRGWCGWCVARIEKTSTCRCTCRLREQREEGRDVLSVRVCVRVCVQASAPREYRCSALPPRCSALLCPALLCVALLARAGSAACRSEAHGRRAESEAEAAATAAWRMQHLFASGLPPFWALRQQLAKQARQRTDTC